MRNLHQLFDWQYIGQIIGEDFAKFCGLLRIYELYDECFVNEAFKLVFQVQFQCVSELHTKIAGSIPSECFKTL